MKKLMIAAAIVCVAALSQAATCSWSTEWLCTSEMTDVDNAKYWVIALGTDASAADNIKVDTTGALVGTWNVVDSGAASAWDFGATINEVKNGDYYSLVVFDADNKQYGIGTDVITGVSIDPPADAMPIVFQTGSDEMGSYFSTTIDAVAVPEPTSGLLLLLGVAGLALRRRRA